MAGGDGEGADVIDMAAVARRDEVGQSQLRLAALVILLLAQRMQARQFFRARHIGIDDDIVAVAVGRIKTVNPAGR